MGSEKIRVDKYLWAIRVFKTRTQAANAIAAGKVKCNGNPVKPAHNITIGETYDIKTDTRKWVIQVTGLIEKRVQYTEAINYYTDITPQQETIQRQKSSFVEYTGKRHSKQGRPTKRNRRELDGLMGF